MPYIKENVLTVGKTKRVWTVERNPKVVILENLPVITKFDDPEQTKELPGKDQLATKTTCEVFRLLQEAQLPVAFIRQISETEFAANQCQMIPLEVVARRLAVGSIIKRCPELAGQGRAGSDKPYRFDELLIEFFLKTTNGGLTIGNREVVSGLNPQNGEGDPLIENPLQDIWNLLHPKKRKDDPKSLLGKPVFATDVLMDPNPAERVMEIQEITGKTFLVLEAAWQKLGYTLIDFKLEFGISNGQLVIADVIDCDSWRLQDAQGEDYSKQSFRDGRDLKEIFKKYELIAFLSEQLSLD